MYSRMTALLSVRHILINDGFVCMHTYAPVTQFCSLLLLLFIEVTVASLTFGTEDLFKKKKKKYPCKNFRGDRNGSRSFGYVLWLFL